MHPALRESKTGCVKICFSRLKVVSVGWHSLSAGGREQAGDDGGKRGAAEAETGAASG